MCNKNNRDKRILYVDPLSYDGHIVFNEGNLRAICNGFVVDTFFRKDYIDYSKYQIDTIFEGDYKNYPNSYHNKISIIKLIRSYLDQFFTIKKALSISKRKQYDLIFFSTVNIIPFSVATLFSKNNIVFIDHGIYFAEKYNWVKVFWKLLGKNIKIGILEDYFRNYIHNKLNNKNEIVLIRHPLRSYREQINDRNNDNCIYVFAPSVSNDEDFIDKLFDNQRLFKENVSIFIKGKKARAAGKIEEYNKRISDVEYIKKFDQCDYILIPYSKEYCYRTSGVLFEAIVAKKPVLVLEGNTLNYYSYKYPNAIRCFNNIYELSEILAKNGIEIDTNLFVSDINRAIEDHSDEMIHNDFINVL